MPYKKRPTKNDYERHLNIIGKSLSDEEFIINGKQRPDRNKYGYYIRNHDPIAFQVGYNEYLINKGWKPEMNDNP
jgi:hypothetical protein